MTPTLHIPKKTRDRCIIFFPGGNGDGFDKRFSYIDSFDYDIIRVSYNTKDGTISFKTIHDALYDQFKELRATYKEIRFLLKSLGGVVGLFFREFADDIVFLASPIIMADKATLPVIYDTPIKQLTINDFIADKTYFNDSMIILHGTEDEKASLNNSKQLPIKLIIVEGATHSTGFEKELMKLYQ